MFSAIPNLPEAVTAGIVAMVKASVKVEGRQKQGNRI
jgi:hypothetical protein